MLDYAGKIAEFVTFNREWIKATRQQLITGWTNYGADRETVKVNSNVGLYRKIEEKIGIPEARNNCQKE